MTRASTAGARHCRRSTWVPPTLRAPRRCTRTPGGGAGEPGDSSCRGSDSHPVRSHSQSGLGLETTGAWSDGRAHPVPNSPLVPSSRAGGQTDPGGGAPTAARPCELRGALGAAEPSGPPAPPPRPLPARPPASSGRAPRRRAARSCRPARAGARRRRSPSPGTGPGAGGPPGRPGRAGRRRCASVGSRCCGGQRGSESDWQGVPGRGVLQPRAQPRTWPVFCGHSPLPTEGPQLVTCRVAHVAHRPRAPACGGSGMGSTAPASSSAYSPSSCARRGARRQGALLRGG